MVGKYCRTFRESEPKLVEDLEDRMRGKYLVDGWRQILDDYLAKEARVLDQKLGSLLNMAERKEEEESRPPFKRRSPSESIEKRIEA